MHPLFHLMADSIAVEGGESMAKMHVETLVEELVQAMIAGTALELVDVEYVKEREWYLRVFLNKEGGIELEDCQWISEQLGSKLDELDPIKESYYLEVSSPGLDRPLKKERDFARHLGERVEVHLFAPINGEKMLVGELLRLENDVIFLQGAEGEIAIPREKAAKVSLEIVF